MRDGGGRCIETSDEQRATIITKERLGETRGVRSRRSRRHHYHHFHQLGPAGGYRGYCGYGAMSKPDTANIVPLADICFPQDGGKKVRVAG